ncbi:unnamed protein product [Brugia pahangi]|uniref:Uncharacterized protein n=1 Tax=Brugia pahangi TaxID=6280 RepID=A0A0N4T481_BRUPA|nr:unnamed protein product [Brugia pahangi]
MKQSKQMRDNATIENIQPNQENSRKRDLPGLVEKKGVLLLCKEVTVFNPDKREHQSQALVLFNVDDTTLYFLA